MNQLNHINPFYDRQEQCRIRARENELRCEQRNADKCVYALARAQEMEDAEEARLAESAACAGEEALAYDRYYYSR